MLKVLLTVWTVMGWLYSTFGLAILLGNSGLPFILSALVILTWVVVASFGAAYILNRLWPVVGVVFNALKKDLTR